MYESLSRFLKFSQFHLSIFIHFNCKYLNSGTFRVYLLDLHILQFSFCPTSLHPLPNYETERRGRGTCLTAAADSPCHLLSYVCFPCPFVLCLWCFGCCCSALPIFVCCSQILLYQGRLLLDFPIINPSVLN